MGPNGRNNSCKSDSLVSSDRLVTRIVADSSTKIQTNFNAKQYISHFQKNGQKYINFDSSEN